MQRFIFAVGLVVAGASTNLPSLAGFWPVQDCCGPSSDVPLFEDTHQEDWFHCAAKCASKCNKLFPGRCQYFQIAQLNNASSRCSGHAGACNPSKEACQLTQAWRRDVLRKSLEVEADRCYTEPNWREQQMWNYSGAFERCGPSTVCVQGFGCQKFCTASEECDGFPMRVCKGAGPAAKCSHKDLFEETAGHDLGAAAAFFIISGLALSAGIGGGGLYVPLLMVFLGFSAHEATGLSQALLAGGASSTLVYNMRQRHPSGCKPMIDYHLVSVMGPNLLIGAFIGSALNMAAPSWLILVLLTTILSHSAWKTLQKARKTLQKERAGEVKGMPANDSRLSKNVIERFCNKIRGICGWHGRLNEVDASKSPSGDEPASPRTVAANPSPQLAAEPQSPMPKDVEASPRTASLDQITLFEASPSDCGASPSARLEEEEEEVRPPTPTSQMESQTTVENLPQFPRSQILQFFLTWLIVVVCIFARGGKASSGLVSYCGQTYWIFTASVMGALALLAIIGAARAVRSTTDASADKDAFQWTAAAARKVAIYSLGAGTLAALCGIGGGMVMGPILLDLGVLPQVQSATTATTLLVLSSSSALAFLVQGTAPVDYALFLAFATALGAVIGKAVMGFLIKLYRRPSAIIFVLGGIILASVVVMAITGTIDVINDIQKGHDLGFKSVCNMGSTDGI